MKWLKEIPLVLVGTRWKLPANVYKKNSAHAGKNDDHKTVKGGGKYSRLMLGSLCLVSPGQIFGALGSCKINF